MQAELCYGFGNSLVWQRPPETIAHLSPHMQSRIDTRLQQGRRKAQKLLQAHSTTLAELASRLEARRQLTGADLAELLRDITPQTPCQEHGADGRGADGVGSDGPGAASVLSCQPACQADPHGAS
jgi:hypothetical protein